MILRSITPQGWWHPQQGFLDNGHGIKAFLLSDFQQRTGRTKKKKILMCSFTLDTDSHAFTKLHIMLNFFSNISRYILDDAHYMSMHTHTHTSGYINISKYLTKIILFLTSYPPPRLNYFGEFMIILFDPAASKTGLLNELMKYLNKINFTIKVKGKLGWVTKIIRILDNDTRWV